VQPFGCDLESGRRENQDAKSRRCHSIVVHALRRTASSARHGLSSPMGPRIGKWGRKGAVRSRWSWDKGWAQRLKRKNQSSHLSSAKGYYRWNEVDEVTPVAQSNAGASSNAQYPHTHRSGDLPALSVDSNENSHSLGLSGHSGNGLSREAQASGLSAIPIRLAASNISDDSWETGTNATLSVPSSSATTATGTSKAGKPAPGRGRAAGPTGSHDPLETPDGSVEGADMVYNRATLVAVTSRSDRLGNAISTHALASGYAAMITVFAICVGIIFAVGENNVYGMQVAVAFVGIWWLLWSCVTWFGLQKRPGPPLPMKKKNYLWFSWVRSKCPCFYFIYFFGSSAD
jgi:hypothetical protein